MSDKNSTGLYVVVGTKSLDYALRVFKRRVENSKILEEYASNAYFLKPSVKKRQKRIKARRDAQKYN